MDILLNNVEVRVLGSLLEKEGTTPEYYPLSSNALVQACNQKTNRDPVVYYDEDTVSEALDSLRAKKLVRPASTPGSRVAKYEHSILEVFNLGRREIAVLCVLMLRGPQTAGELRDRSARMHSFSDLAEVESRLDDLARQGVAKKLPRQPGMKEPRYVHLLAGDVAPETVESRAKPELSRLDTLEAELENLRQQVHEMREELTELRKRVS